MHLLLRNEFIIIRLQTSGSGEPSWVPQVAPCTQAPSEKGVPCTHAPSEKVAPCTCTEWESGTPHTGTEWESGTLHTGTEWESGTLHIGTEWDHDSVILEQRIKQDTHLTLVDLFCSRTLPTAQRNPVMLAHSFSWSWKTHMQKPCNTCPLN